MQDQQLAECLDELYAAWRAGTPVHPDLVRQRFRTDEDDSRLVEFFWKLCHVAEDWRGPDAPTEAGSGPGADADTPPEVPAAESAAGMTLGRYRLLARVASGGMGTVYRALDPTLGREVALKVPHLDPDHPRFEELADQFVREARLAAAVDHPNVCAVYDAGRHDGMPYAVMAMVDGETLAARLKTVGRFRDPLAAADLIRRVAEGVQAAHRRRIVHRDIKPGNILLRRADGQPILTDFGLARAAEQGELVTRPGVVAGTVAYMAPEQAAGDAARIGPPTDVYGLGAVLYQMVTGRLPFEGEARETLDRIRDAVQPPDPTLLCPDLDPRLAAVIRRAMAPDPKDRYADAGELAAALRSLSSPDDPGAPTATFTSEARLRTHRSGRWWWVGGASVLALVGVVVAARALLFPPLPPLDGDLIVRVWTDPQAVDPEGPVKAGVAVDDQTRAALPVRNTDLVHLEVCLNRPAYAYVLWFPGEGGEPTPLFPWDPSPDKGFRVLPEQRKVTELHSPERVDGGWKVIGPDGLETAVLLARETPLSPDELADLEAMIGTLPSTPLGPEQRECAWIGPLARQPDVWERRGTLRGIQTAESRDLVDEPVVALLQRLRSRFDLVKAVRFSHVGSD